VQLQTNWKATVLYVSKLARSLLPSASLGPLYCGLQIHTITGFKYLYELQQWCSSDCTQVQAASRLSICTYIDRLTHYGLEVLSIISSICITKFTQSLPPGVPSILFRHHMQRVHGSPLRSGTPLLRARRVQEGDLPHLAGHPEGWESRLCHPLDRVTVV